MYCARVFLVSITWYEDDTIKTCMYMNAGNQDYTNKGNCDYQPPLEDCQDNTYSCKYTLQFSPPSSEMSS